MIKFSLKEGTGRAKNQTDHGKAEIEYFPLDHGISPGQEPMDPKDPDHPENPDKSEKCKIQSPIYSVEDVEQKTDDRWQDSQKVNGTFPF